MRKEPLPERLKAKDDSFAELFREAKLEAGRTFREIVEHCARRQYQTSIGYLCDLEKIAKKLLRWNWRCVSKKRCSLPTED